MNAGAELKPSFYTTMEGGHWHAWTWGPVTELQLTQRDRVFVELYQQPVHSLAFGALDTDFKRWDCINGWNP